MIKQLIFNPTTAIILTMAIFVATSVYFNNRYYEQYSFSINCEQTGGLLVVITGIDAICVPREGVHIA